MLMNIKHDKVRNSIKGAYMVGYIWLIPKWEASQAIFKGSVEIEAVYLNSNGIPFT